METIQDKINSLDSEEQNHFSEELLDRCYDRDWCMEHDFDYADLDIQKVKEETYKELYLKK